MPAASTATAFAKIVTTVLRIEWNTCCGPKPMADFNLPNRLQILHRWTILLFWNNRIYLPGKRKRRSEGSGHDDQVDEVHGILR